MADPKRPENAPDTPKAPRTTEGTATIAQRRSITDAQRDSIARAMGGFDVGAIQAAAASMTRALGQTSSLAAAIEAMESATDAFDENYLRALRGSFRSSADAFSRAAQVQADALESAGLVSAVSGFAEALKSGLPDLEEAATSYLRSFPVGPPVTSQGAPSSHLHSELKRLREELGDKARALLEASADAADKAVRIKELEATNARLIEVRAVSFLLNQVHSSAAKLLESSASDVLRRAFVDGYPCDAFVLSVDIRRSTELMLKAREPLRFVRFITDLCTELAWIVKDSYGVFDKFTGDGILAFFPSFFSGEDAGYRAILAAEQCHAAFERHYQRGRDVFKSILLDVGLGIGIDYGEAHLAQLPSGFTIVGAPVVYACRMGGAAPKQTLLNQPAYEVARDRYERYLHLEETKIEIKNEGWTLAYSVRPNDKPFSPVDPSWLKDVPKSA